MSIKQKDRNRAELVKAIIKQNGGRIFTVIAKRKTPKKYAIIDEGRGNDQEVVRKIYMNTAKAKSEVQELIDSNYFNVTIHEEHFMTMTCRTGVKKDLKGGQSTISGHEDLISVHLTNGKGYRCFSAYTVLEIKAGGTTIKFKEEDVLAFGEEE